MAIHAQSYPSDVRFLLWDSQDWVIENGCGGFKYKQQQSQQLNPILQQLCNQKNKSNFLVPASTNNNVLPLDPNSQSLAFQLEMQSQEIDHYIKLQGEKLRKKLQEQRMQQVAMLLKKVEVDTLFLMKQKDEEIAQEIKKRVELEEFLSRLEAENQAWRRVAEENEAMILSLNKALEEIKERAYYSFNNVCADDAQSCCDEYRGNNREMEEEEEEEATGRNVKEDDEHSTKKMIVCKSCNSGMSCFLFLPCRHLCSCEACEPFLNSCPVCRMPKKASIQTLIF